MNFNNENCNIIEQINTKYGVLVRLEWRDKPAEQWLVSNLQMRDDNGKILWVSEMPINNEQDCWANPLDNLTEETVELTSHGGWECLIDLRSGKIVSKEWSK